MENKNGINEQLTLRFEGESHIEANLLLESLSNFILAYKESVVAQFEGAEVIVRIRPFEQGSFVVGIDSILFNLPAIIESMPNVINCTKTFLDIIKLKRELCGAPPKSVEAVDNGMKITNAAGDVYYHDSTVFNVYMNNPVIDESLSKVIGSVGRSGRPAISFENDCESVRIDESEYEPMQTTVIDKPLNSQSMFSTVTEVLLIKRADFLGDSKWEFMYKNKAISATLDDEDFKQRVRSGKVKLCAGASIRVEMEIEAFLNDSLDVIRKQYKIKRVIGDIIEPTFDDSQISFN